jgi:hypothetical protein
VLATACVHAARLVSKVEPAWTEALAAHCRVASLNTDVTKVVEVPVKHVGIRAGGLLILRCGNEATRCSGGAAHRNGLGTCHFKGAALEWRVPRRGCGPR